MITIGELRSKFINYFKSKNHLHQPSSSLIPLNDNSILFTNSGMVQFKDIFLGLKKSNLSRVVTIQKCLRIGGKHNDIANVGYTSRHNTFFEMLGNFSFSNYFKKEAIAFAWEFLTEEVNIKKEKLLVTIYSNDTESFNIWHKYIGLPKEKIISINSIDNFWSMGNTGPCGPCTEIFYDHGEKNIKELPITSKNINEERYTEIWNIVFIQYNRHLDGSITNLSYPSIDTGMGIERLLAILQNVHSNYDTDIFQSLIKKTQKIINYNNINSPSLKIIADHIRSSSFLIADGVLPNNEGRGYVLRRIIRRAIYHGNKIGINNIFFYKLLDELISQMNDFYPQLNIKKDFIKKTLIKEEKFFLKTIQCGIKKFNNELNNIKGNIISGDIAFKLYDTYGFPFDLTIDIAKENGLTVDKKTFLKNMNLQKQISKKTNKFHINYHHLIQSKINSKFIDYSTILKNVKILEIYQNNQLVHSINNNNEAIIVLDKTPFYAEAGGQVCDKGIIIGNNCQFVVTNVKKIGDTILHIGTLLNNKLNINQKVIAKVNNKRRLAIAANHTATHLLHKSLKVVLGEHIEQRGSLINEKKLRFDFTHNKSISPDEIQKIELLINKKIYSNDIVKSSLTSKENAKLLGAEALFNEKYDNIVRIISIGNFSIELCGGTHVNSSGEIGLFKIISESSISSEIRRIEAITREQAINYILSNDNKILIIKNMLKTNNINLINKLTSILKKIKNQELQIIKLQQSLLSNSIKFEENKINDIKIIITHTNNIDIKMLRNKVNEYKLNYSKLIIVLTTINNNKIQFAIGVTNSIIKLIKAKDIAKTFNQYINNIKSGGTDIIAQGTGSWNKFINLNQILYEIKFFILNKIKN